MSALAFEGFLSTPEMIEVFGEHSVIQAMMDFEAALAHAQAAAGMIPPNAASAIGGVCKVELYDVPAIVAASGRAGSLAIPLVRKLTETVALFDAEAARYVHWGSTSQDVIDTAMVLVTRKALGLIERQPGSTLIACAARCWPIVKATPAARAHADAAGTVVSFGFRLATWIAPLVRARERLRETAQAALQLQLGGPVGTLSAMGGQGHGGGGAYGAAASVACARGKLAHAARRMGAAWLPGRRVVRLARQDRARPVADGARRDRRTGRALARPGVADRRRCRTSAIRWRRWSRWPRHCARRNASPRCSPRCRRSTSAASATGKPSWPNGLGFSSAPTAP